MINKGLLVVITNDTFNELAKIINKYSNSDGIHSTPIDGLHCYKMSELNIRLPVIYRPSICVVIQGNKQVLLGDNIFKYEQGQYLAISVDLPLIGEVTKASINKPYLCAQIDIDISKMTELAIKLKTNRTPVNKTEKGLFVGNMNAELMSAIIRLMRLLEHPKDIPFLAPAIFQEIYYRLLTGPNGDSIIQTCIDGSNMQRITQIIETMKTQFNSSLNIDELARMINMSTSNFYSQFKKVTGLSPLQYLKHLRLTEARKIMLSEKADATNAAYLVGYESPSQFNREYARLFGEPPLRDIKQFRKQ